MDEKLSSPSYVKWDSGFTLDSLAKRKLGGNGVSREIAYTVTLWEEEASSTFTRPASSNATRRRRKAAAKEPSQAPVAQNQAHKLLGEVIGAVESWKVRKASPRSYMGNSKEAFRRRMVVADKALASKTDFNAMLREL